MTHFFEFSNEELLTLSAALQVYYTTAPEFGKEAFIGPHANLFEPDEVSDAMETALKTLIDKLNAELLKVYPHEHEDKENPREWWELIDKLPSNEKRVAVLATYAVEGAQMFRQMVTGLMEQLVAIMDVVSEAPSDPMPRPNDPRLN